MAKRQLRVQCDTTAPEETWKVDAPNGANVTPLVKELQKYSDFAAILPPMGPGAKIIEVEVEDA
jgi:hypothetical protein